jgi:hypothetical protein
VLGSAEDLRSVRGIGGDELDRGAGRARTVAQASRPRSALRATSAMPRAPASANWIAAARPTPAVPPAISTVLSNNARAACE